MSSVESTLAGARRSVERAIKLQTKKNEANLALIEKLEAERAKAIQAHELGTQELTKLTLLRQQLAITGDTTVTEEIPVVPVTPRQVNPTLQEIIEILGDGSMRVKDIVVKLTALHNQLGVVRSNNLGAYVNQLLSGAKRTLPGSESPTKIFEAVSRGIYRVSEGFRAKAPGSYHLVHQEIPPSSPQPKRYPTGATVEEPSELSETHTPEELLSMQFPD